MSQPHALLDTSALVRALIAGLPSHAKARRYLDRARVGDATIAVSTHALAELFATITALPTRPQHTPEDAASLIDSACQFVQVVELGTADYRQSIERMAHLDLSSGAVYDALHVAAAEKVEAAELVTFNGKDFQRMPPQGPTELVVLA